MSSLAPGTALGRYVVRRLLGQGGMGAVYEAVHVDLEHRVAVKTLLPAAGADADLRARFLREGRLSARVDHPHVVKVLDVGAEGDLLYLVMEYLEGEDLKSLLARAGRLAVADALDLLLPVIAGVAEAHREGVVHRDLKPANIFLQRSRDGLVAPKVLDFGIARLLDPGEAELTQTKFALGTVGYMAPEQVQSARRVDAAGDQYALGAVLYHCLTGRKPFSGELSYELMTAVVHGEFPPPRALAPELPEAVERVVLRAMRTDPAARFASVVELGRALLALASPAARARWEPVFGAPGEESGGTILVAPRAPSPSAPPSLPPSTPALAAASPGTLSSAVTTAPSRPSPPRRAAALAAVVGALALVGAVVAVAWNQPRAPAAAVSATLRAPAVSPAPPALPAPPAPAVPAPTPRVDTPPSPVVVTATADEPAAEPRGRHRRRAHASRRGRGAAPGTTAAPAHGTNSMPILE